MRHRIVYTRKRDGGVSVCCPAPEAIKWLGCGGFWGHVTRGFADAQIERQIARGVLPDAAWRYVKAMLLGGCSTQEALAIIRDRDCAHLGTGIELWDIDDVPTDRTYRDAWRRSHNGGPICLDQRKVMEIDEERMWKAYERSRR